MLQSHTWLRETFKVQDKPVDFNVTEYESFTGTVSDSTLQLIFKEQSLIKFWYNTKKEYPQLSER